MSVVSGSVLRRVEVCLNLCKVDSKITELRLIDGLYLMITQLCSVEHCMTLASAIQVFC